MISAKEKNSFSRKSQTITHGLFEMLNFKNDLGIIH